MPSDENLLEYWDDLHPPGPPRASTPREPGTHPGDLVIGTSRDRILVRIHPDGTLTYGPDYTPDEAAVEFWTQMAIRRLESEERVIHLGVMEQILQRLGNADMAYEAAVLRSRRPEATEHDRYMAEVGHLNLESVVHQTVEFARGLVLRPDPPPPVAQLMRPGYRPGESFVHQQAIDTTPEAGAIISPFCVCGAPWVNDRCAREAGIFPSSTVEAPPETASAPQHTFCTSCEAAPWHHDFDPEPHCQCGNRWEHGECSFIAAAMGSLL